ncbi:MAG TPA: hypothetical protein VGM19_09985 [Armatimonadota bacterium]|jgi:hypothetical protein
MTKSQFRILIVLTVVSGFLGGAVSNLLLRGAPVAAQMAEAKAPDAVRAKTFEVVDDQGNVCARLGVDEEGGSSLDLYGVVGKTGAVLSDTGISLHDAAGRPRALLGTGNDGSPLLGLYDATGDVRAGLSLQTDGSPILGMMDAAGEMRVSLHTLADERIGLSLYDSAGEGRASLGLAADGSPGLSLADAAGKPRAVMGCAATRDKLTDAETKYTESTLILSKANGEVLWQAP